MTKEFDINAMPQFDAMIGAVNEKRITNEEGAGDERFVVFKTGNSYRFRLCWPVDPFGRRQTPWIFRVTHADFGNGRTNTEITCPTSDYIMGRRGFRSCKACECSGEFYNDFKNNGSTTSEELYKHFKRNYRYVALAYVVSDSLNPKNAGQFMLVRITKGIADYLNRRVFGWATSKGEMPLAQDRIMGKAAFLMDAGHDLVIDVSTEQTANGSYNSYSAEFMPQPTKVPVTQADCNKAALEMKFDEDFYLQSNAIEIDNFVKTAIMGLKMEYEVNGTPADFNPANLDQGNINAAANPNVSTATKVNSKAPSVMTGQQSVTEAKKAESFSVSGDTELDNVLNELNIQ